MSSGGERRQQNIPKGNYPQKEVVNPQGSAAGPSRPPAQTGEHARGDKWYDLMKRVVVKHNMELALLRVERNKGAAGIDGVTVKTLRKHLKEHRPAVKEQLVQGTYKPKPVRRVEIPKPDGGVRLVGIPTTLDCLIQQAFLQVLTPIFDSQFSDHSYRFRPERSAHQAVKKAQGYSNEGYRYVVDIDLEKFFDRVNHDILMSRVARKIGDKQVLKLIRAYLNAGVCSPGAW
jgi:group II intron reverse transcriptase/maturase